MKTLFAALALVALSAVPASAQTAAQSVTGAVTQAAKESAAQAASEQVDKALGTKPAKDGKHEMKHEKGGPNHGKSESHRQDGEHGHKGKNKH